MKNKSGLALIALLIVGLVIGLTYFGTKNISPDNQIIAKGNESFNKQNVLQLKVDTFVRLLHQKYGDKVQTRDSNQVLWVNLKNLGNAAPEFYNEKSELLTFKINDYGFQIRRDSLTSGLETRFKIDSSLVTVPNDVIMGLMKP